MLADKWKNMSQARKEPYEQQAEMDARRYKLEVYSTPCLKKKLCKLIFCHNFAKFRRIVKLFGTKIAERTSFSEVYSFSTSPNLCQRTTA